MSHLWAYLLHGEDVGQRLLLGLVAGGALIGANGVPASTEQWVALVVVFLTATTSKNEKAAKKIGRKG